MHTEFTPTTTALFAQDGRSAPSCVTLRFEESVISVPADITVAAALLMNGVGHFRTTPVSASPRAAYCMMGVCFECLVEVDGVAGRQACLTIVREGMEVRRQQGASDLASTAAGENNGC